MKKFLSLMMSLLLITLTASGAFAVIYGEAGYETEGQTEATAWEINSAKVLMKVRDDVNDGKFRDSYPYFKLIKDIDITSETDWNPIGSGNKSIYKDFPFNGVFDGDGHTVKVKISKFGYNERAGLFGNVNGGTIKNLSVQGNISYHEVLGAGDAGGIVCYLHSGTIQKCTFDGYISIQGSQEYSGLRNPAGGIVGRTDGNTCKIINCKVGSKQETTIHAVNGQGTGAGGIVAVFNDASTTTQLVGNYAKLRFTGSPAKSGGIYAERSGFKGTVSNNTYVDPDEPDDPEEPEPEELEMEAEYETNWTVKKSYSATAEVKGGTAPYKWTKSGTATWLALKNKTGNQVTLAGTPKEAGTFTVKIKVTDADGQTESKSFKIKVTAPTITGTFKAGVIKTTYSGSATVSGGLAPYTWTKSGVPAGLTFKISGTNKNKITLSGKPTTAKSYSFKVTAKDKNGASVSKTFAIKITQPAITGTFKAGVTNTTYSGSATVSGGTAPYTWTKSGVPAGLTFKISGTNKNKITLSGKPTKVGTYSFKVTAKDKNKISATKTFTIKITKPAPKLAISGSFNEGFLGETYSQTLKVTGGTTPYTWKKSGTLPNGLKISKNSTGTTLKLSGTPSVAGDFSFKFTVTDAKGLVLTKTYAINISEEEEFEEVDINSAKAKAKLTDASTIINVNKKSSEPEINKKFSVATTELKVLSEDVLWQGEGRDEDLIEVKADTPVNFIIGEWVNASGVKVNVKAEDIYIYVDDKPIEDILASESGEFVIPAEFVHGDFKVQAKANEFETIELFISAIK